MDYTEFKFKEFVTSALRNLPLEEQKEILKKMQKSWLPEIDAEIFSGYRLCEVCKKYSKLEDFEEYTEEKVERLTTHRDCGYGEDDRTGDVRCLIIYDICPICQNKIYKERKRLEILAEYDRYNNRIK